MTDLFNYEALPDTPSAILGVVVTGSWRKLAPEDVVRTRDGHSVRVIEVLPTGIVGRFTPHCIFSTWEPNGSYLKSHWPHPHDLMVTAEPPPPIAGNPRWRERLAAGVVGVLTLAGIVVLMTMASHGW
jgi:hypothetical protein